MCRLCAVTQTKIDAINVDLLDRMLLVSQTDDLGVGHVDGCGVSNGSVICKSAARYSSTVFGLFNPEKFPTTGLNLLGHVRKASSLTGRTRDESHPYTFTIKGERTLHCAHNGWITGSGVHQKDDAADTDSWRAFAQLAAILEKSETGNITPLVMEEWLQNYSDASQMGFMMLYDGVLYIFRHNKPIHAMTFANGYVLNTAKEVLMVIQGWLQSRHGLDTGEIFELPEEALITFRPGEEVFYAEPLSIEYKTYRYNNNYVSNYNTSYTPATSQVSPKSTEAAAEARAAPATKGAAEATAIPIDKESNVFRRILPVAQEIRRAANPMRFTLYSHWLRKSLGITSGPTYEAQMMSISDDDLELFQRMNGKWSARQADLINIWNKLVDKHEDVATHTAIFGGDRWFWLDPWFISAEVSRECALNRLRKEIQEYI